MPTKLVAAVLAAVTVAALAASPAEARRHPAAAWTDQEFCGDRYGACAGTPLVSPGEPRRSRRAVRTARRKASARPTHGERPAAERRPLAGSGRAAEPGKADPPTIKGYEAHIARSAKLKDLTKKLAVKVAEILAQCSGSRLTSGYRPGARVRGSGRPSLHSHYPSKAADMAGNPSCIRGHLARWPGGVSTDYAAVRHYHFSYAPNGREWGVRFAHYGHRHARKTRYAAAR